MGRIVYLDADGNRSEVTAESVKYADDHWKFVVEEHDEEYKTIIKTKWIPRERVVEAETETEKEKTEKKLWDE